MRFALSAVLFFLITMNSFSQGCSDAGICTVGAFKPDAYLQKEGSNNILFLTGSYGVGDEKLSVLGFNVGYKRNWGSSFRSEIKLTGASHSRDDFSVTGLGDLFVSFQYSLKNIDLTAGVKLPLSDGNEMDTDEILPLDLQPSLGTTDLLAGLSFNISGIQCGLAFQKSLNNSKNDYYNSTLNPSPSSKYEYIREADLMLRLAYPIELNGSWSITPNLLPIYHLKNDSYKNNSEIIELEDSKGLTLNAGCYLDYNFSNGNGLQFNFALPLVTRDLRPDGLTRKFVTALQYQLKF